MGDQFLHGRLIIVVAYHAAGDSGCPGAYGGLVDDKDILARTASPGFELLCQVPGSAQSMDSCPDNDVFLMGWK